MSTVGTRAIELVRRAGVEHRVHQYEPETRHGTARQARPAYGLEAAAALGIEPERIYKTLVVSVDGHLALAVVPVAGELDLKRFAEAMRGRRAELADPAAAERATGSVIGGISPLAPRRPLPVVLDSGADAHRTIFVSAGRRGVQIELAPGDLARLSGAASAPIDRDH